MILTNHLQPSPVHIDFRIVNTNNEASDFKDHPFEMCLESTQACTVAYFTPDELDHLIELAQQARTEYEFKKLGIA